MIGDNVELLLMSVVTSLMMSLVTFLVTYITRTYQMT